LAGPVCRQAENPFCDGDVTINVPFFALHWQALLSGRMGVSCAQLVLRLLVRRNSCATARLSLKPSMLRIRNSVLVLALALLLWLPTQESAAQTASRVSPSNSGQNAITQKTAASGTIRHVSVRGSEENLEIEIDTAGGTTSPDTQAIADPDRIVIDFPGALPASELRALEVNRGALKRIRTGLFFNNPPITRVVLDLNGPQTYRVMSAVNAVIIKLESKSETAAVATANSTTGSDTRLESASSAANPYVLPTISNAAMHVTSNASVSIVRTPITHELPESSLTQNPVQNSIHSATVTGNSAQMVSSPTAGAQLEGLPTLLPQDQAQQNQARSVALASIPLRVDYAAGLLTIHAAKATLAQVLFEVQRQTKAEIAIPAGAEQEGVVADIGPASARDVLASLLNGSHYNFIFVGEEERLEKVILTQREFAN
jgi:hypothetical protein